MADNPVSPPAENQSLPLNKGEIIDNQAGQEGGEGASNDPILESEKPIELTPHQVKRIKSLSYNLKVMREENQKMKEELNKMKSSYKKNEEQDNFSDSDFDDLFDDSDKSEKIEKLINEKLDKREREKVKNIFFENMGIRTNAEREKFDKGLDILADNFIKVEPDLSYERALQLAWQIRTNKDITDNSNDSSLGALGFSSGGQVNQSHSSGFLSTRVVELARNAGVSKEILAEYEKLKSNKNNL